MIEPGRKFVQSAKKYRYGFNGKENDNEVKGEGNQQDYGMRIYDPRLGKFLSVDPLSSNFPFYTPYQFAGNKPIWATDLDGAEEFILRWGGSWETILTLPKAPSIPLPPMTPPLPPVMPPGFTMPQSPTLPPGPYVPVPPSSPSIVKSTPIDESGINPNDATTYPTPPFNGEWKVSPIKPGTKGYNKLKDQNASRLENDKGDVLRWHSPDKYHPKGHWDFKRGGNDNNPWENYTPDGVKIPEGQIYGKDFNPPVLIISDPFPARGYLPLSYPAFLKKQYLNLKKKIMDYDKKVDEYQNNMKDYQKKLKKYEKELKKYQKEKEDYRKDHPPETFA